jgi:carboxypeptidase C (cathepsin A)
MKQNQIKILSQFLLVALLVFLLSTTVSLAKEKVKTTVDNDKAQTESKLDREGKKEEEEKYSQTLHAITIDGKRRTYCAIAGNLVIRQENKDVKGSLFYVAYQLKDEELSQRPITFVFNGGPGSSSVWLHMGALGPKRIRLTDDGRTLPPPVKYGENPYSWLAFTDLVLVDPIGTGFSRSVPDDEETKKKFHGVKQDIESVAKFIRLYLTRNNRWTSPKFLAGESYGTTRVSGLTWYLHQRYGIDLNGVILISPVLDYNTILFHPSNDLPYILFLPTYAATAWYHQSLSDSLQKKELEDLLREVESFCLNTYTTFLAKGEKLDEEERKILIKKLAAYTSHSEDLIEKNNYRINWIEFTKNFLGDRRKLVGRMDTTIIGIRPDPTRPYPKYDPSFEPLFGPFSSAVNGYIRDELKFESDLVYEFLNKDVNNKWDWSSGLIKEQGYIDVSHTLRDALAVNKYLKVFIASGYYDLATPYFATEYTINHMWLEEQHANISMNYYESGHMIYTHIEEHKRLFQDVMSFYREAI